MDNKIPRIPLTHGVIILKMKINNLIYLCVVASSSCASGPDQFSSKTEIQKFSINNPYNKENWFYCGSDSNNHHFMTRIGGNSSVFIIPKNEIDLARTIDLPPPGVITLYQIYPDKNFSFGSKKIEWYYQ